MTAIDMAGENVDSPGAVAMSDFDHSEMPSAVSDAATASLQSDS
jgi:hypothetical protein